MPFPQDNRSFEKGTLDGYGCSSHALCGAVSGFDIGGAKLWPVHGSFMARIDDLRAVDHDGVRSIAAQDTSPYSYVDGRHNRTYGIDGSWIECDVALQADEKLVFTWNFVSCETRLPWNDFAYFAAYDGTDTSATPAFEQKLCDALELRTGREIAYQAGNRNLRGRMCWWWQVAQFVPGRPFNGKVRWISSNGISASRASRPPPSPRQRAWPSTLLLDCLEIIRF